MAPFDRSARPTRWFQEGEGRDPGTGAMLIHLGFRAAPG